MVMAVEGTFDYVFVVPRGGSDTAWSGSLRDPLPTGEKRLLGHSPVISFSDYETDFGVPRTRIVLTPSGILSQKSEYSFPVDRSLARMLRPADVIHISRDGCAGLGLSVLRNSNLVAGVGAVTNVVLGNEISVRTPWDLVQHAEATFRVRDPEFDLYELPLEIAANGQTRLLYRARVRMGRYEAFVIHGALRGLPGTSECMSLSLIGVCPDCAASLTAQLLDRADAVQVPRGRDQGSS